MTDDSDDDLFAVRPAPAPALPPRRSRTPAAAPAPPAPPPRQSFRSTAPAPLYAQARLGAGPNWKPDKCADCDRRHPMFNRDGGKPGTPWRCRFCDRTAKPLPRDL